MKKLFSVIIAVYNREDLIRKAIESVLEQTFTDYELIVVDDGSTDRTQDILRSYGARIKVIRQENQGQEAAYITGVSHSVGKYIAFLDSDDYFLPNTLATYDLIITTLDFPPLVIGAIHRIIGNQDVRIDAGLMDSNIKVLKYRDYLSKDVRIPMSQSMIVMKKTLFEEVQKGIGHLPRQHLNDYSLILRVGTFGPCIILTKPITIVYRFHPTQATRNIERMCKELLPLIDIVRHGQTAAGRSRRFDRYAFLGGPVSEWSRKALKAKQFKLAFRIIVKGWSMVVANQINKFLFLFYSSSTPVEIETK